MMMMCVGVLAEVRKCSRQHVKIAINLQSPIRIIDDVIIPHQKARQHAGTYPNFPVRPGETLQFCGRMLTNSISFTMKLLIHFLLAIATLALPALGVRDQCDEAAINSRVDCYDTGGPCDNLPIPDSAFGRTPDPEKGYFIETLRPGMYAVGEGSYFFLVVLSALRTQKSKKGGKNKGYEVAIFDFPEGNFVLRNSTTGAVTGSLVTNAIDEIVFNMNNLTKSDIRKVQMVYTHGHFDHIGAATITHKHIEDNWDFVDEIDIIAHEGVLEEFEERIEANYFSGRAPLPTSYVRPGKKTTKSVGDQFLYTLDPVSGHSDGKDLAVFFEQNGDEPAVLMFIDVIFPKWAPFFNFAITTDVFDFLEVHKYLLANYDLGEDGILIAGHLSLLGGKADIVTSLNFVEAVLVGAGEGLATANLGDIGAASGVFDPESNNFGNSMLLFDLYFKEVVRICAKEVVAKFGCTLAALDTVIDSHCRSAQSFLRVDF
jgi:glyoxylase-like metal-dependent hydrolase (beta-lactamase superfamily II)